MTHPITPPPELVQQWVAEVWHEGTPVRVALSDVHIASRAAQWGADQELEACCEWLSDGEGESCVPPMLRAARRPKPPSLKEEALGGLDQLAVRLTEAGVAVDLDTIRRALRALPDD